ncbi:MAG: 50S ribosome-binding GTPase [Firmicutes bacterium]|nr:50S ribosome-binding GTPase [Bacillota bacterium]
MRVLSSEFITSIGRKEDNTDFGLPHIAVFGKSNVGKSSFINYFANHSKLAKVSGTPGKTRLINIFKFKLEVEKQSDIAVEVIGQGEPTSTEPNNINLDRADVADRAESATSLTTTEFILADFPGYGYARAPKTEIAKWTRLINDYFKNCKHLYHALCLIDVRRTPSKDDLDLINYLNHHNIGFTIIATKLDKVGKTHLKKHIQNIATTLKIGADNIIGISSYDKIGKDKVLKKLVSVLTNV